MAKINDYCADLIARCIAEKALEHEYAPLMVVNVTGASTVINQYSGVRNDRPLTARTAAKAVIAAWGGEL